MRCPYASPTAASSGIDPLAFALLLPAERLSRAPLLALLRDHELMNQPVGGMSGLGRRL